MAGVSPHGVLVVDKPRGPTSHDLVALARRHFATRRVGHAGTLDPMATGVMLLLFGEATKLSRHLAGSDKRYQATICFGIGTDTLDADGQVTERRDPLDFELPLDQLDAALAAELVRTEQIPPLVSALKVAGRRAHRLARQGECVTLPARPVRISQLARLHVAGHELVVDAVVSKGYYVRALARDLGGRLGLPAHLSKLRRLASGPFEIDEAVSWPPPAETRLLPPEQAARRALPNIRLTSAGALHAANGRRLGDDDFADDPAPSHDQAEAQGQAVAWLAPDGQLVALGQRRAANHYAVVRGFRW